MPSAALHRLESLLQARKLDRTMARPLDPGGQTAATGIGALDDALAGGWRRGEVSEMYGGPSTGRTSALVATLAEATSRGEIVGLVDTFDQFDPITAAAAGLDLDRVLWVRGMRTTPGALDGARRRAWRSAHDPISPALDVVHRAVRALDLIVRAGGFGVAAIDLADVPARSLQALPFTTWRRLAHANEGQSTVCLLVGRVAIGRSARGASVELGASTRWTGSSRQSRRFAGFDVQARVGQTQRSTHSEPRWILRAVS